MLNSSQVNTMLILRNREDNIFSRLPIEIIREISEFGQDPNSDFGVALKHVARGELQEAEAILERAKNEPDKSKLKELLLQTGTVVTRAGLTVNYKTLLECALGEGDPDMTAMLISYFSEFKGGEKEKERQLERYRPLIKGMLNKEPYDLTELINIIKNSSATDVTAALNKNMEHASELRDALIQFRKDVSPGTVKKPQMHYNYQTLIHAFEIYDREWDNLLRAGVYNRDKVNVVWRQVIGYLQKGLPAVDRFSFARGRVGGDKLPPSERKTNCEYGNGSFPDTVSTDLSLAGLGGDYGIHADGYATWSGWGGSASGLVGVDRMLIAFIKLMSSKIDRLVELTDLPNLCSAAPPQPKQA